VHEARPDAGCVLHTHTRAGVAVSAQAEGLLPLSQISLLPFASLAYHDYEGIALNEDEKPRLVADLGDCRFLVLRNHGLLTVGESIPEAFLYMYALETACQTQIAAQSGGNELIRVPDAIVRGIRAQVDQVLKGSGAELAWPGLLRKLDRVDSSFRD
jgi:ribulose-5-phosphate 4-epimerase/fuculose-1-phosphate aldolase